MSKTVKISIDTDNAAFGDTEYDRYAEIARILREAANRVEVGDHCGEFTLRDINGNRVGAFIQ